MIDPDLKELWLKALRSGEYKQTRRFLCIEKNGQDRYCCLGVLYDQLEDKEWHQKEDPTMPTVKVWGTPHSDIGPEIISTGLLPNSILLETGLTYPQEATLAEMNDRGKKFTTIANWIEKYL